MSEARYEVVRPIARGGMAEVLLARRIEPGGATRQVALKRVLPELSDDPRLVRMFLDEARLACRIHHPNVVEVIEAGQGEFGPFLAMELVDGPSLDVLRVSYPGRRVPPALACGIIGQICAGLHHAHALRDETGRSLGIVHRDVSPQNILLGRDGVARLADFGVAKAKTHAMRTMAGVLKGKVSYLSPEQLQNEPIDGRADVFSLGVVLFECLTGQRLYKRSRPADAIEEIVLAPVPRLRDVAPELGVPLDRIVRRCLAKRPAERFESAAALGAALRDHLSREGLDGGPRAIATAVAEILERPVAVPVGTMEGSYTLVAGSRSGLAALLAVAAVIVVSLVLLAALLWE